MLFSLLKHYLDTNTALKVSQSVYCFTTSISYAVENYFPRLWGMGISDAIFHCVCFLSGTNSGLQILYLVRHTLAGISGCVYVVSHAYYYVHPTGVPASGVPLGFQTF